MARHDFDIAGGGGRRGLALRVTSGESARQNDPVAALLAAVVALAIVAVCALLVSGGAIDSLSLRTGAAIAVVDGDTVRVDGRLTRLVGFNMPETMSPRCAAEADLGRRATERLSEILASGNASVTTVACACRPGTEGTDACNYARACGVLTVDGRDVGAMLIAEGLAVPFVCTGTGCPPTPRPWCASS